MADKRRNKNEKNKKEFWMCIVGPVLRKELPNGSDLPMRNAARKMFHEITGRYPDSISSGWGVDEKKKEAVMCEWCKGDKDSLYNKVGERLWEKLEYYRDTLDISWVDFKKPFPIDQLVKGNPIVAELIDEVQKEFKYKMSEFQCSWAVNQFIKGGLKQMKIYNKNSKLNLNPRA